MKEHVGWVNDRISCTTENMNILLLRFCLHMYLSLFHRQWSMPRRGKRPEGHNAETQQNWPQGTASSGVARQRGIFWHSASGSSQQHPCWESQSDRWESSAQSALYSLGYFVHSNQATHMSVCGRGFSCCQKHHSSNSNRKPLAILFIRTKLLTRSYVVVDFPVVKNIIRTIATEGHWWFSGLLRNRHPRLLDSV